MSNPVIAESAGRIAVIRFNRPAARNPLSVSVIESIGAELDRIEADDTTNGIIFTGSDGIFASGADLREIAGVSAEGARDFARLGQALMSRIAKFRKPIAAAVNGPCFGGAFDLALACHFRIASPNSVFCHPGVRLGIITGWGGTQRLPRLIGEARALEMLLTAKRLVAGDALEIGLIDDIAESPETHILGDSGFFFNYPKSNKS